jgi:hypothetical protein
VNAFSDRQVILSDLKQRYIAKKWLSFFDKLAQSLVWLRLYYERRFADARNIQEVIKPYGWSNDDSYSAYRIV